MFPFLVILLLLVMHSSWIHVLQPPGWALRRSNSKGFFALFSPGRKSAEVTAQSSARVHARSSSSSAAHHDAAVVREEFWVLVMAEEHSYFWNRADRTSHWEMPLGIRPGWVMSRDGFFVHTETQKVLNSLSGMH